MAQPSKKPAMGKKTPKVNAKALTSTRKSDKEANPKSPRNLRDIKFTKDRLKMEAGVKKTQAKNAKKKVLGGDTY
jgi:hypothetical protein